MSWRVARSLETLLGQVNVLHPARSKTDDGTIGDERHQATNSDHNPNAAGVVTALDLTHDPASGFDSYAFADMLKANRDHRIKYIISNHRISNPSIQSGAWRDYHGSDPHTGHIHISVSADPSLYDDASSWTLGDAHTDVEADAGWSSGKGSWFSQYRGKFAWVDEGDKPGSNALGVPDDHQGIAFYNRASLGHWFDVQAPNGCTLKLQQTDIGPHPRTGRKIDIAAVAAEHFGYSPNDFPTNGTFKWRPHMTDTTQPTQVPSTVVVAPSQEQIDALATALQKKMQPAESAMLTAVISAVVAALPHLGVWGLVASQLLASSGVMGAAIGAGTTPTGQAVATTFLGMLASGLVNAFNRPKS